MMDRVQLPHLETNVTLSCNNRCVACNHFAPMQRGGAMREPLTIADDLARLSQVAYAERWAAIGGEPTLHREIVEILQIAKTSGIADIIELWTNGQTLRRLGVGIWQHLDEMHVTRYPDKLTDEDVEWINRRGLDTGVRVIWKNGEDDFTRLLYPAGATDDEQAAARYRGCWYRTYCHVVDDGYFYRCCTAPFVGLLVMGLPAGTDGLALEGITADALRAYLAQEETPAGCYRCAAHNGEHIGWREVDWRASGAEWLRESGG